jgi:hypothetical protein
MYENFLERNTLHAPLISSLTHGVTGISEVTVTEITEAGVTDITETGVTQISMVGVIEVADPGVTEAPEITVQPSDRVTRTSVATHLGESSKNPSKKNKGKGKKMVEGAACRRVNYFATPHEHGVDVITRAILVKFDILGFGAPPHVNNAMYRALCEVSSILVSKLHCMAFHHKDN